MSRLTGLDLCETPSMRSDLDKKIDWAVGLDYDSIAGGVAELRQGFTPRPAAPIASCLET